MHPCRDPYGDALYDFEGENFQLPFGPRPQCVRLLPLLEDIVNSDEPDLTELKTVLCALIESGQRHTMHGFNAPTPEMPCARTGRKSDGERIVYCRYLMPRPMQRFDEDKKGVVVDDPHRPGMRSLCLERNDALINNFETHMLLLNLGNIDWRALLNLWSVLEYLTKYTTKGGKGSRNLAKVFDEVLTAVKSHEEEDGVHDLWRRTIMKFYSKVIGDREYSLFETVHFGLRLPPTLSSFQNVTNVSVSNWAVVKSAQELKGSTDKNARATKLSKLDFKT